MKFPSLIFLLVLIINIGNAATIKGRVTDETGAGLSFATVLIKGTTNGTSANADGYYTLDVATGSHTITCQFIGYKSASKLVNVNNVTESLNFQLSPQTLEVGEVTVKANGEDPAYPIMRQVIAKRKYHEDLVKNFETDVYLKGVMRMRDVPKSFMGQKISGKDLEESGLDSNGKGVMYLLEQFTEYSYQAPNKTFNRVVSIRESGDPNGVGWATLPPVINIYNNNIQLFSGLNERGFISPANSNAFLYYKFKFLGSYMDGDRMINKIQVIPRRKFVPTFSGNVYVVDDEWVFQSVELTLTKESQINQLDTLRLYQYYVPVAKDVWIIQNQVLYPALKIMGFDIGGNFVTSYKNQKVNEPIDKSRFATKVISTYDTAANNRTVGYWDTLRAIPLEEDEVKDFKYKDSVYAFRKQNRDSLSKIPSYNLGVASFILSGPSIRVGKNTWSMKPIISSIAYNTVEGINATLGLAWQHRFTENNVLTSSLQSRYGFSNKHFNSLLRLNYQSNDTQWRGRSWRATLDAGQYVYQLNNNNPITPFINELYTLFGGKNYMKIYENRLGKINVQRDWGNGLKASVGTSFERRMPLYNTTDYTFSEKHDARITPNQPATLPLFQEHNAVLINASVSYQPGWKFIQYPKYKQSIPSNSPIFAARYTKGIPNILESKSDFDKWSVEVEHSLRLRMLGKLDYRLMAGGFLNNNYVGVQDMKHLFGNQTFLANPYLNSFQLAPYYRFSNTAEIYGQAHAEWHLSGWLTNSIPGFRRLNWHLVGGSNILYIDDKNYYAEVFVGLENIGFKIFRFGRVDFIAGYESGKDKPSVGVRLGFGEAMWALLGISNGRGE